MLKSIVKSLRIIPTNCVKRVKGTVNLLDMPTLAIMSLQELRNLAITQVQWYGVNSLGFTLSDGKTCKAGTSYDFAKSHVFDKSKKITKIVIIVENSESLIDQIKFFSGEEVLCTVGYDDDFVQHYGGRVESFEIAADEQLIGCELDHGTKYDGDEDDFIRGITWLKWKINN